MSEQVLISAVGQDESIALGVVEPLDLTAEHADIPLQRTPSLEYHPLRFRSSPRGSRAAERLIPAVGYPLFVTPFRG
ncbi:hypothetical protein PCLA_05r0348 [Pseudomonas citronellolis]|nr:hypothetical protein PCLA_05r0348 [Pseudomonas citronellolis]